MSISKKSVSLVLIVVSLEVACYEKTLRKIVRDQSKMVQRPFSESDDINANWRKSSAADHHHMKEELMFSGHAQLKTLINTLQRPKISTIISSVDTGRGKPPNSKMKIGKSNNIFPIEHRLTRNSNRTVPLHSTTEGTLFPNQNKNSLTNRSSPREITAERSNEIPNHSQIVDQEENHIEQKIDGKDDTIIIPEKRELAINNNIFVKGIFIGNSGVNPRGARNGKGDSLVSDSDKVDFLIEEKPNHADSAQYSYSRNVSMNTCTVLKNVAADIDAQEKFAKFDIEPSWKSKKHFWNHIFDSRYESLMRNQKWPALKVILIPRTHVDSIWRRTFEQYHNDSVHKILSNVVKKMQFYSNFTFTWNEVSHLSQWWKTTTAKSRSAFRRLVRGGRLEITTGGWVETDEATTHFFGLVHQLIEGHQWLKTNLNYLPKVSWLTNSVTHSPTMTYLIAASGMSTSVITNLHYSWEEYLAEYQYSDFIWLQNWDSDITNPTDLNIALNKIGTERFPKNSVLTHYLQFNSAGFKACGPNQKMCVNNFNFARASKHVNVYSYNVKEKSEMFLEQYSKTGTITPHNVIIAPIGGPYRYEFQSEFDYQYNNYQKVADYVNVNRDIYKATIEFGTPRDYFKAILKRQKRIPTLKGDFLNFADLRNGSPAYWTGFFTSRPLFKILIRRLQSTLRSTELLFSFAITLNAFRGFDSDNVFDLLIKAREVVARLLDRNVASGTLTANSLKYVHNLILSTAKDCWYIQEISVSLLCTKTDKKAPHLQKYVYREGEFISVFRTVFPGDQIYVFNSLSQERTEVIELTVRNPNIIIIDHNNKEVTIQTNPVWKYTSDNLVKISRRFYKIMFAIIVPPMTLELYRIKETYDAKQNAATLYCTACIVDDDTVNDFVFPFNIRPIETGDVQLESYKYRLIFDELTGFLKTVVDKVTNIEKSTVIDYGAFRSSSINSGMFLFNTNISKPLHDILMPYRIGIQSKILFIVSGQVATELTAIYGRLLQSTVKIFNLMSSPLSNAIYIESKVDYEVSPKNRDLELFLTIQTDIRNGNHPEIYTDSNGFQYIARDLNISRRIESNLYPITTMCYIQDQKSRLTLITDHAQAATVLQEGQLLIMLDRRVLFNDGRGANEGLADSSATIQRHLILLENLFDTSHRKFSSETYLQLPSLSAVNLANSHNYIMDIFIVERNQTDLSYYAFLPLIKTPFPCDVDLINYRIILNKGNLQNHTPNSALMILHRKSISCRIDHDITQLQCKAETFLSLHQILHNLKAVYQTNLCGTNNGVPMTNLNLVNFAPMELTTLRIHF